MVNLPLANLEGEDEGDICGSGRDQDRGWPPFREVWPLMSVLNTAFDILTKLGPVAVASMVAYIAWRQWVTARDKLAIDLFDRRFTAWTHFGDAMGIRLNEVEAAISKGESPIDATEGQVLFVRSIHKAELLFGQEVVNELLEINKGISLLIKASPFKGESQESLDAAKRRDAITDIIADHYANASKLSKAYMTIGRMNVTRPLPRPSLSFGARVRGRLMMLRPWSKGA